MWCVEEICSDGRESKFLHLRSCSVDFRKAFFINCPVPACYFTPRHVHIYQ